MRDAKLKKGVLSKSISLAPDGFKSSFNS